METDSGINQNVTYPLHNKRQRLAWQKQRDQEINESLSHPEDHRKQWCDILIESRPPYCPDCPLRKDGKARRIQGGEID